jgi:hypothetical protein
MKLIKLVALTAFITIGTLSAIVYTSCTKDACRGVTCLNKGTCTGGMCVCPGPADSSGIGGLNCEIVYRNLYAGNYKGYPKSGAGPKDSVSSLTFFPKNDTTNYNTMTMVWKDTGTVVANFEIKLIHHSSSGSTFVVPSTPGTNGKTYSGSGTVSQTSASVTLKDETSTPAQYVILTNFTKQ